MSLVARALEAHGLPTVCLASALGIVEAARPPRTAFLDYPLGRTAGRPFDPADQLAVMRDALRAFTAIDTTGRILRLDRRWAPDERWRDDALGGSGDTRTPRHTTPRYQCEADRLAAER